MTSLEDRQENINAIVQEIREAELNVKIHVIEAIATVMRQFREGMSQEAKDEFESFAQVLDARAASNKADLAKLEEPE